MRKQKFYIRHSSFNRESGSVQYGDIVEYKGSVMPEYNNRSIQMYGERINSMLTCSLRKEYAKDIADGDLAYIYVEKPTVELRTGEYADYVVQSVVKGNQLVVIKFEKRHKEV